MTTRLTFFIIIFFIILPLKAGETFTVVIDAGHGGGNKGAVHENFEEKELTLQIALKLKTLFAGRSVTAIFTRTTDIELPPKKRAEQIESLKPDLFISLHFNSQSFITTNRGFEIYYPADSLISEPAEMVKYFHRANCSFHYGSVFKELYLDSAIFKIWSLPFNMFTQKHDLLLFDETTVPGLLLEIAYLTSPEDRACIENNEFINDIAKFIFEAVKKSSQEKCY
ncbi:MAG TPA: N-acetylmuramoyl-L-alanine amidase [bacterium]|nr:N-acetylmuramoyl-L-alanine amidase [bacterium]HPS30137.1 N-acetylmuramoyl-L-alanine amidase [bacterium]